MWNKECRTYLRTDIEGLYGHLYDLEQEELGLHPRHLPHRERKDRDEYEKYRTKRLVLEAYDELAASDILVEPEAVEA